MTAATLLALGGCKGNPEPVPPTAPAAAVPASKIAEAETARVGALARVQVKGLIEIRSKDESGEHFDQGDLDLRWNPAMGLAVSGSKFGDRWVWLGTDTTQWWIFDLKGKPTSLRSGSLAAPGASLVAVFPWLVGARPLVPVTTADPQTADGKVRATVAAPKGTLPQGATLVAEYDAVSLRPTASTLTLQDGRVIRAAFTEWVGVETTGAAPGAWPRLPKRIEITGDAAKGVSSLVVFVSEARGDAEAVDRANLYDLAGLTERFKPEKVEKEP